MSDNDGASDAAAYPTPQQTPRALRLPSSVESITEEMKKERRGRVLIHEGGFTAVQERTQKGPMVGTKIYATSPALKEGNIRGPPQERGEERRSSGGQSMFDSWFASDFELGEWVRKYTRREVKHRWSMEI